MEQTLCKFKPNPKPTLRLGTSRILLNLVISADVQKEHAHLVFLYSFTMKFLMLNWVGMIQLMFGLLMKMFMKKMWVQEFFCEINLHLKNLFIFCETNFTKIIIALGSTSGFSTCWYWWISFIRQNLYKFLTDWSLPIF